MLNDQLSAAARAAAAAQALHDQQLKSEAGKAARLEAQLLDMRAAMAQLGSSFEALKQQVELDDARRAHLAGEHLASGR
jgi:hypothetical protein